MLNPLALENYRWLEDKEEVIYRYCILAALFLGLDVLLPATMVAVMVLSLYYAFAFYLQMLRAKGKF